jgi:GNAT superfamily N-acetyltransferase
MDREQSAPEFRSCLATQGGVWLTPRPTVFALAGRLSDVVTRLATRSDAGAVAATISEGFETYRAWAPSDWTPPVVGEGDQERFAGALARADVWFLLAESDGTVIGHVALSLSTREDPGPPPPGTLFIWQLFVRPAWHGHGTATVLTRAAVAEAMTRGFSHMRLWTPEGAARARRLYEREGWTHTGRVHRRSDVGCRRSNTAATSPERWIDAARRNVRQTHVGARRPHRLAHNDPQTRMPHRVSARAPGARKIRQPRRHDRFILPPPWRRVIASAT